MLHFYISFSDVFRGYRNGKWIKWFNAIHCSFSADDKPTFTHTNTYTCTHIHHYKTTL